MTCVHVRVYPAAGEGVVINHRIPHHIIGTVVLLFDRASLSVVLMTVRRNMVNDPVLYFLTLVFQSIDAGVRACVGLITCVFCLQ